MQVPEGERKPTSFVVLTALASLMLPVIGVVTAIIGVFEAGRGHSGGWYWIGSGVFLIIADMSIDWVWGRKMHAKRIKIDPPRPSPDIVGLLVTVVDPISNGGRGSVLAADHLYLAEGADAIAGTRVKVTGVNGTVLRVERI
jgi:membrane protein implicated in regulation of membrane protease activity